MPTPDGTSSKRRRIPEALHDGRARSRSVVMKSFACGDVVPNCSARFRAENEDDLLRQVAQHARDDHGLADLPEGLVSAVRARILDVAG
jgi:predicted small metal-binding protein